jgi:hypothetical protein
MTRQEFFELVKGKPMRYSYWDREAYVNIMLYFIPTALGDDNDIRGVNILANGNRQNDSWVMPHNLSIDAHGDYWYIAYDIIAEQEIDKLLSE